MLPWPACDRHSLARLFSSASAESFRDRPAEQFVVARQYSFDRQSGNLEPRSSFVLFLAPVQMHMDVADRSPAHVRLRDIVAYSADLEQMYLLGRASIRERAAAPNNAGRSFGRVGLPSVHWRHFAMRLDATLHNDFFSGHVSEVPRRVRIPAHSQVFADGGKRD